MVSIVLPAYNPPAGWEKTVVSGFQEIAESIIEPIELILVNDGSTRSVSQETVDYISQNIPSFRYLHYQENQGKGYALRKGVAEASGDMILYTDTDFPYTTRSLIAVYKGLKEEKNDVVIGIKDKDYYRGVPLVRKLISRFLRKMIRVFLSMPVSDTQCGLKGFQAAQKQLFLKTTINRYLFDLEFVHSCYTHKPPLKIKAQPVSLKPGIVFRKMNTRVLAGELKNFAKVLFRQ